MLKNDGRILGNGSNIFKSQVVDSYVQIGSPYSNQLNFQLSGLTITNPFNIYYKTPLGTTKNSYIYDSYYSIFNQQTDEGSYKPFYFSGNLNALISIEFINQYYSSNYYYKGDLINLLGQFPNCRSFKMNYYNNSYYNYSIFNQNLSNILLPKNINDFEIADNTLSGNINTIQNLYNVQTLNFTGCLFNGNFSNISFSNLKNLTLSRLYFLNGNLANIISNNPNLEYLYIDACNLFDGDISSTNISSIKNLYLNIQQAPGVIGSITNWTFNTGMTQFNLNYQYISGDITNWDISNTLMQNFQIYNYYYNQPYGKITGSLSGWTMPNTINAIILNNLSGVTSVPQNFSNCPQLQELYILDCRDVVNNLNDFVFNDSISFIYFHNYNQGNLRGDIGTFVMPTGVTFMGIDYNKITGNIANMTLNSVIGNLSLNNNLIYGEVNGMVFPNSLNTFYVGWNSGITVNLNLGVLNMNNVSSIYWNSISAITGSFANITFNAPSISEFRIDTTPVHSDLSTLKPNKIYYLYANDCGTGMTGNLTNWLTGATNLQMVRIYNNSKLSGDTSTWEINTIRDIEIDYTKLGGALKHNNVYFLSASYTKITSNIETDLNFSSNGYWVNLQGCTGMTGNLSGVTLGNNQYLFYLYGCTGIVGANAFIDYLFLNKVNFTNSYLVVDIRNIGDNVTGATETLGNMGTWTGSPWDLTEFQVNNLALGKDYGGGPIIYAPWDTKNKAYWLIYSQVSSTNPTHRYTPYFQINYN
jgi:hypothetical protein